MDKGLRKASIEILRELTACSKNRRFDSRIFIALQTPTEDAPVKAIDRADIDSVNALEYLTSRGSLAKRDDHQFELTAQGWDYQEELEYPRRFWLKNNWFPALVALGTFITSVAAIVTAIVTLIWRGA